MSTLIGRATSQKGRVALLNAGMSKNSLLGAEVFEHALVAAVSFAVSFAFSVLITSSLIHALRLFGLYFEFMYEAWVVACVGGAMSAGYTLVPLALCFKKGYNIKRYRYEKVENVLILLFALVLLMSASLVACNNRGNAAQKERANQTSRVEQTFLSGINEKWSANLSDEEIATLENAGDYVVTKGWTSLVCDVVNASSLQTAKIKSLADSLESEEGKKLLKEFSNNAELLVPMLKQIGLTASDVSTLAYDLISKLISDGRTTVSNIVDRLDNVKDVMIRNSASAAALENVSANRAVLNLAKQSLNATDAQKSEMQSALSNAQSAMSELIAFAYDTSVNTLTDELYSKLFGDDGALSNVSESELATLVSALLSNVSRLKNALTQSEIEKLDVALDLFISNFDNKSISSAVYSQIIKYAKYAYMAVDVIPSLCDVALASKDVMSNKDFITDFLSVVKLDEEKKLNESTSSLNKLVLAARLIDGVMESGKFDQNGINGLIDRVCEQGAEGYQKLCR